MATTTDISNSWHENKLLCDLSSENLDALSSILKVAEFKAGESIIEDGSKGKEVYLITKGSVDIKKDNLLIASKEVNECFGFMAFVDDAKRSADVIAKNDTIVYFFNKEDLAQLDSNQLYSILLANHIKEQQSVVRNMNASVVSEMKAKLAHAQNSLYSGRFFIVLVLFLVFYQFVLGVFIEFTSLQGNKDLMDVLNPSLMVFFGIAAFLKAYFSKYPLSEYGLNLDNWKKNIIESLLWTAIFILVLFVLKWMSSFFIEEFKGKPILDTSEMQRFGSMNKVFLIYGLYAVLAPVQEFIARGVIQGSLSRVLTGSNAVIFSILLSNLMFSAMHIHMDIRFAILTLVPGIFWGVMYSKQKSILGVSISHAIIGIFVFLFMGLI